MVLVFGPPVPLAYGVVPHLIPAGLAGVPWVLGLEAGQDVSHQRPPLPALAIVVMGEEVESVLTGGSAQLLNGPNCKRKKSGLQTTALTTWKGSTNRIKEDLSMEFIMARWVSLGRLK